MRGDRENDGWSSVCAEQANATAAAKIRQGPKSRTHRCICVLYETVMGFKTCVGVFTSHR